jgi:hypothetical protein
MGEMERRVSKRTLLLAALLAWTADVSCGSGIHDANEEHSTTAMATRGGSVEFMGAKLDLCDTCLPSDENVRITLTWQRAIAHLGARSSVYELKVPEVGTFTNDPGITISTTHEIASRPSSVIGFMVPAIGRWVPNTSKPQSACSDSDVCGVVQSQTFQRPDPVNYPGLTSTVLRLAIVTRCETGDATACLEGETCDSGACQQCPDNSPCP